MQIENKDIKMFITLKSLIRNIKCWKKKVIIFKLFQLSNCYLDHMGNLKITDFGMSVGDSDKKAYNFHILQNICYVAPEVCLYIK